MAIVTITDTTVDGQGTPPDAPSALTTEREWDGVRLHWTNPTQRDVDYIEIWRATVNNRASATMVAQVKGNDYVDHSLETGTRYYWLRSISTTGVYSIDYHPASATAGVSGIPDQVDPSGAVDKDVLQYNSATQTWTTGALRGNTRLAGEMQATTNLNYVFPPQTLSTVTDNNGYSAASSFPAGTTGYGANASFTHYYGDTLAGVNTAPAFNFRNANGNSSTGDTIPFTGLTSVAPSATLSGNVMGTQNYNGYGTTGFTNDIATTYQGGGINALSSMQVQSYPTETFSDSVLTLTSTNVTAVASSFRATMGSPTVVGTKGQIQYSGTSGAVGQAVRVTGALTGNATGIVSGQTYYMIVYSNNGTNSFATLSATPGGVPITTSGNTLTGLTLTRCSISFTTTGLTNVPFGRGALVTVSGITNVTDGTYPVWGTPTTATFNLGVPHTTPPTMAGAQTFSCRTVYMGSGFRIRAFPTATPATLQNRLEVIDMAPGATTIRTNSLTLNTGAYGNTGTNIATLDATKAAFAVPVAFPVYTKAQAATITGAVGWQICISDSAGGSNPNGMMAFWDTTNARWSYVHDNTAV